jgi:uncharacterized protein YifN (PemK superfamily)
MFSQKPLVLVVTRKKAKKLSKRNVPVPSVNSQKKFSRKFPRRFSRNSQTKKKAFFKRRPQNAKAKVLHALSAKSLATGHLSVLCGQRLNSKPKLWIFSRQDMILQNGT